MRSASPTLRPTLLGALVAVACLLGPLAACDGAVSVDDPEDVTSGALSDAANPYAPENFAPDTTPIDDDAPRPVYPGQPCADDDECSTGLCWGTASSQGHFSPRVCQTRCINHEDFTKYCDSDSDCCTGTCCVGCGPREGLCVND